MNAHRLFALGCLLLGLLSAAPASAQRWGEPRDDEGVSLDEAVRRARGSNRQVMSARTIEQGGRRYHVIRALTPEGRVQRFEMNARRDGLRDRDR